MGDLATSRVGSPVYLGEDIDVRFGEGVCLLLFVDTPTDSLDRVRIFCAGFRPTEISFLGLPDESLGLDRSSETWKNLEKIGAAWTDVPMVLHNPSPHQLAHW